MCSVDDFLFTASRLRADSAPPGPWSAGSHPASPSAGGHPDEPPPPPPMTARVEPGALRRLTATLVAAAGGAGGGSAGAGGGAGAEAGVAVEVPEAEVEYALAHGRYADRYHTQCLVSRPLWGSRTDGAAGKHRSTGGGGSSSSDGAATAEVPQYLREWGVHVGGGALLVLQLEPDQHEDGSSSGVEGSVVSVRSLAASSDGGASDAGALGSVASVASVDSGSSAASSRSSSYGGGSVTTQSGATAAGVRLTPRVRLVHWYSFARPTLHQWRRQRAAAAAATAEPALPFAATQHVPTVPLEIHEIRRPLSELRALAPRLLGAALPADLAPLMLSGAGSSWPPAPGDREAAAAASYAFAAWLAGLPLQGSKLQQPRGEKQKQQPAGGSSGGGSSNGLLQLLWRRTGAALVRHAAPLPPSAPPLAAASGNDSKLGAAGDAAASATATATATSPPAEVPTMGIATAAEAWAEFERRLLLLPVPVSPSASFSDGSSGSDSSNRGIGSSGAGGGSEEESEGVAAAAVETGEVESEVEAAAREWLSLI
ncbi:hypothetical protein HXX76_014788 [Chlamydomonas incerta]|uniref:Uncharacterized protein n=1 Tax=Chlamydomonas incerta TaxID=51695 RepID=A0A835SKQ0_CHLIN|nr:hypothetical protein HXX76_014788 [Chlamydomonas incerta]|eukprot:KAG2424114.1 hypothetical protein HXX76_014788 [Chlamydomonas incerta]